MLRLRKRGELRVRGVKNPPSPRRWRASADPPMPTSLRVKLRRVERLQRTGRKVGFLSHWSVVTGLLPNDQNVSSGKGLHSSHDTNCASPPCFRVRDLMRALARKSFSALSNSERNRPRSGSARCRRWPLRTITKKSCVRSWASGTNGRTGR